MYKTNTSYCAQKGFAFFLITKLKFLTKFPN